MKHCQQLKAVLRLLTIFALLQVSVQYCYLMKLLSFSTWDTPGYGLKMFLHEQNNSLSSITYVREEVAVPVWHLLMLQHQRKRKNGQSGGAPRTLYNSSYKTCEFWKYVRRIGVFSNAAQQMLSQSASNMSLACPLKVGVYAMNAIQVPPDTGMLKLMYHPNTIYTLIGTVYNLSPRKGVGKVGLSLRPDVYATNYQVTAG